MDHKLDYSVVRIFKTSGEPAGAGFVITDRYVATCSHVVQYAIGLNDNEYPDEKPEILLDVDLPLIAPGQKFKAYLHEWQPPRSDRSGDIALLELVGSIPEKIRPARVIWDVDLWKHPFRTFGFPPPNSYAEYERYKEDGVWASGRILAHTATGWFQIEDEKVTGYFVQKGFSGAPVWDEELDAVVGLVVVSETADGVKAAFFLPVHSLIEAFPFLKEKVISVSPPTFQPPVWLSTIFTQHQDIALWLQWSFVTMLGWNLGIIHGAFQGVLCVCGWPIIAFVQWLVLKRSIINAGRWALMSTGLLFLLAILGLNFKGSLFWATLGLTVGVAQWLVLQRFLSKTDWWVFATAIGWTVGWVIYGFGRLAGWFLKGDLTVDVSGIGDISNLAIVVALGGTFASIAQWVILRQRVPRAFWWILSSVACWLIAAIVISLIADPIWKQISTVSGSSDITTIDQFWEGFFPLLSCVIGVLSLGTLFAVITGVALVWILKQHKLRENETLNLGI